jgi:ATP-dependent DNA helicase DinG
MFDARSYLGDDSPLRDALTGFRTRPEQVALADAVGACFSGDGHLIAEAGTGVGKSLAYLVPAAFAGRTVVVSTYTRSLQDQLRTQDVPLARAATGMPITAAVVKGRANYLCHAQLETAESRLDLWDVDGFERIRPWIASTRTGDRDELDHLPTPTLWRELAVGPDRCRGRRCLHADRCFADRARAAAGECDVVLVNHALYMADLGLRAASDGQISILPQHDLVVFDEAHMLEDVAAEWLGVRFSHGVIARFSRDVERAADGARIEIPAEELRRLALHAERLFGALPDGARTRLREPHLRLLPRDAADGMRQAFGEVARSLRGNGDEPEALARFADAQALALASVLNPDHDDTVVWSERRDRGEVELRTAPIDVAPRLESLLFDQVEGAVLVSATLALADGFAHQRRRLGLRSARELRVGSPFDIEGNARLYVPATGPLGGGQQGTAPTWVAEQIVELVRASRGRALVLFASYRQLGAVYDLLAGRIPYRLLRQGEAPRDRLLEWFREDVSSVLLATTSFWQGVDVPGEALSLVIIDKLPFAPPDDPLVSARCELAARSGRSGFGDVQLPRAAMMLKQGFGRLLRSETDRGVVAVLDRRLVASTYGATLLAALPDVPRLADAVEVAAFLAHRPAEQPLGS